MSTLNFGMYLFVLTNALSAQVDSSRKSRPHAPMDASTTEGHRARAILQHVLDIFSDLRTALDEIPNIVTDLLLISCSPRVDDSSSAQALSYLAGS